MERGDNKDAAERRIRGEVGTPREHTGKVARKTAVERKTYTHIISRRGGGGEGGKMETRGRKDRIMEGKFNRTQQK